MVKRSGAFDRSFYETQSNHTFASDRKAIEHFLAGGGREFSPHPLFDTGYYLRRYADIEQSDMIPLLHFLQHGARESRRPHPAFDTAYYLACLPASKTTKVNPLTHYIRNAPRQPSLQPNPIFDTSRYLEECSELRGGRISPLQQWLEEDHEHFPGQDMQPDAFAAGPWRGDAIVVSHEASRTGAPLVALHIVRHLKETHNFRCLVILERGGELVDEFREYADVTILEQHWRALAEGSSGIARLLKANIVTAPDYVLVNSFESYPTMSALSEIGIPFISLIHEFGSCYPPDLVANVISWSDHLVFSSEIVRTSAEETVGHPLPEATIQPQGFFHEASTVTDRAEKRRQVRQELEIDDSAAIILGCGTVNHRKGCDLFIQTAIQALALTPDEPFVFVWIGDPSSRADERDFMREVHKSIRRHRLQGRVKFVGSRKDIDLYFQSSDVFLLTSRLDPFPCVVLHAMAASVPVVCFDQTTGAASLFQDGQAGITVGRLDVAEAAEKVAYLLIDPDARRRMGDRAFEMINERFHYGNYVDALLCTHDRTITRSDIESGDS